MHNKLEITFEGDHVRVLSEGDKDFAFSVKLWTDVSELCRQQDCFNVLGIATTNSPLEAVEGYDHARLFRDLGIDHKYRIAWVEKSDAGRDIIEFIETVLSNRGLPGRLFESVEEAEDWLLRSD